MKTIFQMLSIIVSCAICIGLLKLSQIILTYLVYEVTDSAILFAVVLFISAVVSCIAGLFGLLFFKNWIPSSVRGLTFLIYICFMIANLILFGVKIKALDMGGLTTTIPLVIAGLFALSSTTRMMTFYSMKDTSMSEFVKK